MIIPQPNGCGHVHAYADPEESTRDVGYDPAVPILHARLALSKLKLNFAVNAPARKPTNAHGGQCKRAVLQKAFGGAS